MPVKQELLPKGANVLTTMWAIKLKSKGTCRLNGRGYEQVDRSHYASDSIATPVANPITVQIILMLLCKHPSWTLAIINVEGAFLQGRFENGEDLFIKILMIFKNGMWMM